MKDGRDYLKRRLLFTFWELESRSVNLTQVSKKMKYIRIRPLNLKYT